MQGLTGPSLDKLGIAVHLHTSGAQATQEHMCDLQEILTPRLAGEFAWHGCSAIWTRLAAVERSFEEREAGIGKSEADGTTKAARDCEVDNLHR